LACDQRVPADGDGGGSDDDDGHDDDGKVTGTWLVGSQKGFRRSRYFADKLSQNDPE